MQKTNDILNWHFNPTDFAQKAENLFIERTKNSVNASISSLHRLANSLPEGGTKASKHLISDAYLLFIKYSAKEYNKELNSIFTARKIRILIWALDYHPSENGNVILFSNIFVNALKLITIKWKDSFLISLTHIYLKNWLTLHNYPTNKVLLENTLINYCNSYAGIRKDISRLISTSNLFLNSDSANSFAAKLIESKTPLCNANILLNQKEHILNYEFFAEIASRYIVTIKSNTISSAEVVGFYEFLVKHNRKKITMLLCSKALIKDVFENYSEIATTETVKLIADPLKIQSWTHADLSPNEQQIVENGRRKLKVLVSKQFIEIFFQKLVRDRYRKKFWLHNLGKIDDFKFLGNERKYKSLKKIESIANSIDYRYIVNASRSNTCALIIYSKEYVLVEFTDTGALYIYKKSNFQINLSAIRNMDTLKRWSTEKYACKNSTRANRVDLQAEGRITHQGDWQSRVSTWMRHYLND